jgi:hypothetical protein
MESFLHRGQDLLGLFIVLAIDWFDNGYHPQ